MLSAEEHGVHRPPWYKREAAGQEQGEDEKLYHCVAVGDDIAASDRGDRIDERREDEQ